MGTYLILSEWSDTLIFTNGNIKLQGQATQGIDSHENQEMHEIKIKAKKEK